MLRPPPRSTLFPTRRSSDLLELRGPGEVLGTRQTGEMEFRIADILRDEYMIDDVKAVATEMLSNHSDRVQPLIQRWLGKADRYGEVG